jgi:hypothetical protein
MTCITQRRPAALCPPWGIWAAGIRCGDERPKALESFGRTDPRDAGCDQTMAALHIYVELAAAGQDPTNTHPGIAAHLAACGPCREDFIGLLAAVTGSSSG